MSLRSAAHGGLVLSALVALPACSGAPEAPEPLAADELAIKGGYIDKDDRAIVGLAINLFNGSGEICSGTLISPNVVLTAHHCVAPVFGEGANGINCNVTYFGDPYPPKYFQITTADLISDTFSGSHLVQEVVVPPGGNLICGFDQAILVLTENVDPAEAVPRAPRVDVVVTKGEKYSAIGFGGTDDNGTGAGQRRRRDNLFVSCVGTECPKATVTPAELVGDTGICHGDSGGPAVDSLGRVIRRHLARHRRLREPHVRGRVFVGAMDHGHHEERRVARRQCAACVGQWRLDRSAILDAGRRALLAAERLPLGALRR